MRRCKVCVCVWGVCIYLANAPLRPNCTCSLCPSAVRMCCVLQQRQKTCAAHAAVLLHSCANRFMCSFRVLSCGVVVCCWHGAFENSGIHAAAAVAQQYATQDTTHTKAATVLVYWWCSAYKSCITAVLLHYCTVVATVALMYGRVKVAVCRVR